MNDVEWTQEQKDRLSKLKAGNRKGLYIDNRNRKCQITADQVLEIKKLLSDGLFYQEILAETGRSIYHIKGVSSGKYDYLLSSDDIKKYPRGSIQRAVGILTAERIKKVHEYYSAHPGCTIEEAVTFIPETKYIVEKYNKTLAGDTHELECFGNYNTKLKSCAFCDVAVECYHRSDIGED